MKRKPNHLTRLVTLACVAAPLCSPAAITDLGDFTKDSDGEESFSTVFNGGTQMFSYDSGDVYVALEATFTNPTNPGVLDTSASFGGVSSNVESGDLFGQNWEQSTIGVTYYGGRNDIAGVTINPGEPITLVMKYELNGVGVDGDTVKFWVNPALGTGVESTPDDADPGRIWGPGEVTSDDLGFRRGSDSENEIEFADITIYDGGDSPFNVPEPSGVLLSGLGLLTLLYRRR